MCRGDFWLSGGMCRSGVENEVGWGFVTFLYDTGHEYT